MRSDSYCQCCQSTDDASVGLWVWSRLFFGVWLYKYLRDRRIITQARRAKELHTDTHAPQETFTGGRWLSLAQVASLSREAYGRLLANYFQLGTHPESHNGFLVSTLRALQWHVYCRDARRW